MVNKSVNPALNQLNQLRGFQLPNNIKQIKNWMNMAKGMSNPQLFLQQVIQKNPQLKNIMNYMNESGGNPEKAFYSMAKDMGVNPQDVLKMLNDI